MPASFRQHLWVLALSGMALVSTACVHHVHQHPTRVVAKAPPPWAPAHGHRHVHHDLTLVFDSQLDCYTVGGHRDYFFHRDHYYRWRADRWERAPRVAGPWRVVVLDRLPPGLRGWHARRHAGRLEREARQRRAEHERARERHEHEQERAHLRRAHERVAERARKARRLERESRERARELERETERKAERERREREKRRAELREREERRAETRERAERRSEARREREREERRAEVRREREREARRAEERERHEREPALREHKREGLKRVRDRRLPAKRRADEREPKAKQKTPETKDYDERRRAGKERGVRSDQGDLPAGAASATH